MHQPMDFRLQPEHNLIVIRAGETLLFEELLATVPEFMAHNDFRSGMNALVDMSQTQSVGGNLQVLVDSVDDLTDASYIPVEARTVFWIPGSESLRRMLHGFCIMTAYTRVEHRVAESLDGVREFLELPQHITEQSLAALFATSPG